jgi:hypothetical protein
MTTMTVREHKQNCRNEGAAEYSIGVAVSENPYRMGSIEWIEWRHGWQAAQNVSGRPQGEMPHWLPGR